jgi:hypothetical protein
VVVGIKYCPYFCSGKNVLCTIKIYGDDKDMTIRGTPLDSKLPKFDVIDSSILNMEREQILKEKKSL